MGIIGRGGASPSSSGSILFDMRFDDRSGGGPPIIIPAAGPAAASNPLRSASDGPPDGGRSIGLDAGTFAACCSSSAFRLSASDGPPDGATGGFGRVSAAGFCWAACNAAILWAIVIPAGAIVVWCRRLWTGLPSGWCLWCLRRFCFGPAPAGGFGPPPPGPAPGGAIVVADRIPPKPGTFMFAKRSPSLPGGGRAAAGFGSGSAGLLNIAIRSASLPGTRFSGSGF
jgi:hypothetical protein